MKVIITGTTGMVGEGVMLECFDNAAITDILSVSRKPTGYNHPKLKEYIVSDFLALKENDEKFAGYDACFFCAGVSSVGMDAATYQRNTYDTTLNFARALNPNRKMSFIYVSGAGTDSTEQGKLNWARVKGKTENDLMKLPFKQAFGFRPTIMIPFKGQKYVLKFYNYFSWLIPFIKIISPNSVATLTQVAKAMIQVAAKGYHKNIIETKDIKILSAVR